MWCNNLNSSSYYENPGKISISSKSRKSCALYDFLQCWRLISHKHSNSTSLKKIKKQTKKTQKTTFYYAFLGTCLKKFQPQLLFLLVSLNPMFFSSLHLPLIPFVSAFLSSYPQKPGLSCLQAMVKGTRTELWWGTTETWDPSVAVERDGHKSSL